MEHLKDYHDPEKLDKYTEINVFATNLHKYNLDLVLPVHNSVIFEFPCGEGQYIRRYFEKGAKKVIATDIIPTQIEVSKNKDKKAEIPEGFVEYYLHDARKPKQLSNTLADTCASVHLLCFAETYDELREMVRTMYMNVKAGALCVIILCSVGDDDERFRQAVESHDEQLIHLDPPTTDKMIPRKIRTFCTFFDFPRQIWPHDIVCQALKEVGFSSTEVVPYKFNPSVDDPDDYQNYIDAVGMKMILTKKES